MERHVVRLAVFFFLLLSASLTTSQARDWHVKPDGSGDAPTIQAAVDSAADHDVIYLHEGTFTGPGNYDILIDGKSYLSIKNKKYSDTYQIGTCVIDCQGNGRGFHLVNAAYISFSAVTITNGDAQRGGGIYSVNSSVLAHLCSFQDNTALDLGGGICFLGDLYLRLYNCEFDGNEATSGGGMYNQGSDNDIWGCVFSENIATSLGGGLYSAGTHTTIDTCTFAYNSAGSGGGIYTNDSVVALYGVLIAFSTSGEAIACGGTAPEFRSCDFFGNDGGDYAGCAAGMEGVNCNFSEDPLFCGLGSYYLSDNSPCWLYSDPPDCEEWKIGALPARCGSIDVKPKSWGEIKALYND